MPGGLLIGSYKSAPDDWVEDQEGPILVDIKGRPIFAAGPSMPAALGQTTMAQSLPVVLPSDQTVKTQQAGAQGITYATFGAAYAGYATPTDLLTISGAANKIVRVQQLVMWVAQTAGALQTFYFIKRSAANTGGTASTPTPTPVDSADAAATAVIRLYSVIPAGLGAGIELGRQTSTVAATTAAPTAISWANVYPNAASASNVGQPAKPMILRGAAESFCLNFGGAALPAGFTAFWSVVHTEEAI